MKTKLPRIASVEVIGPTALKVRWQDGGEDYVDLAGWIATGGDTLASLQSPEGFGRARIGDYGASIEWADDDDLAIDATHLELLAREQQPFTRVEAKDWQAQMRISNHEAAKFFNVALSTWSSYKSGAPIPDVIGMICRATVRDPLLMQAHYKPSKAVGRPKKVRSA